ncbi:PIN domain-containing protein [Flavobacteriaceae bacterium SZ-1-7]|uniref:PIN domain-containing protein n=1 Tax=Tamlana sedimenti TaxID=3134126 RepID=UPI00312661BD
MIVEDKIVFLDTSVFESENYFEGRNINILFNLAKEELIHLKMTDIVYREILNRIENHAVKAVNIYKKDKLNFEREARILRNTNVLSGHFERVDFKELKEKAKREIQEKFHQVIAEFRVEVIDTSIVDIKEVLEDYFETKPPFKDGLKKNEFPDALSINAIKKWCGKTSNTAIHLSNDKDFDEYAEESIDCSHDLSGLLEFLFTENSDIQYEFITAIYKKSIGEIEVSIEKELSEDLSSLAYSELENDAYYQDVEVDFLEINDFELKIGVINEIEDETFSYEIEMNIIFSVEAYYTDLSMAYYDKEDGVWWGEERISETKMYSVNTLIYADFELEANKIDGNFIEITDFEFREVEEI